MIPIWCGCWRARARQGSGLSISPTSRAGPMPCARALVVSAKVKSNAPDAASDAPVGGAAACLAGSCSQATLQQITNAERAMLVLHLDADQVVAGKEEARRALAWAR